LADVQSECRVEYLAERQKYHDTVPLTIKENPCHLSEKDCSFEIRGLKGQLEPAS
jgi:hypothetical protein